jgi:hypothetical protein
MKKEMFAAGCSNPILKNKIPSIQAPEPFLPFKTTLDRKESPEESIEPKNRASQKSVYVQTVLFVLTSADVGTMFEPTDTRRNRLPP